MHVEIDIPQQRLWLMAADRTALEFPVSTAANGAGEQDGSLCTPRGEHVICAKIGDGCAPNTVFVGRQPTGECYTPGLAVQEPGRDWILTRILWLEGCEAGRNLGGEVDTRARYIYIHGAPDEVAMGQPGSHGCIRMRNDDVITLFDRVEVGTRVLIRA